MKRKNSSWALMALALFCCYPVVAQRLPPANYIIVSVESLFNKSFEGARTYYWIVPADSLQTPTSTYYPLLLGSLTRNSLDRCCAGKPIDPYTLTSADSSFDLGTAYYKDLEQLRVCILKGRKNILLMTKKWLIADQKQTITFYATPVTGIFCSSEYAESGRRRTGYSGKVFLPFSSFKPDDGFWQTDKADLVWHEFFSKLLFDSVP